MGKGKRAKVKEKRVKAAKRFKEAKRLNEDIKNESKVLKQNSSKSDNVEGNNKKGARLKEEKNSKKGFNFNYLFIFFFACVLVFSIYQIVMWAVDMKKSEEQHQELLSQVVISGAIDNENNGNEVSNDGGAAAEDVVKIDFEKLLEINEDVVGWIMIEGTNINYPILQSYDNNYYLRRDINRHISKSGSIYMDYRNDGFSDKNTVLYGHNMKNGTMFAELEKIYSGELGNDVKIRVFVPDASIIDEVVEGAETSEKNAELNNVKIYKVFSTYSIRPDAFNMNISINEALDYTKIDFVGGDELKGDEQVLTLFTCTDSMAERIIVHAVFDNLQ